LWAGEAKKRKNQALRGGGKLNRKGCCIIQLGLAVALLAGTLGSVWAENSLARSWRSGNPVLIAYDSSPNQENLSSPARSAEGEGTGEPLLLSLQDCIQTALKNNLDLAVEAYNPKMSEEEIRKEKGVFDPLFYSELDYAEYKVPTNRGGFYLTLAPGLKIFPDEYENRTWDVGLKQRLLTGTSYDLRFQNSRWYSLLDPSINANFYAFNPSYTSVLSLTLTQPLLKNFGLDVNRAKINIARNNKEISLQQFRGQVFKVVSEVQSAYWDLVAAMESLEVNRRSLKLAQDLLEINKAKVKAGTLAPLEIVAAEAEVAAREEGVIVAENQIRSVEDRLRRILNLPRDSQLWERPIRPAEKPVLAEISFSEEESLKRALELRPEYVQAKKDLTNKDIYARFARNQLFPSLNLQGSAGLNGIGENWHDSFHELRGGDYYSYAVGLVLEVPLGNRSARGEYAKACLDRDKSKATLVNLEQKITLEIREAIRQIQTNRKRIDATEKARILAEKKLEVEQKKLSVGMSTNFEVLRTQRDLLEAETNWIKALLDYTKSLVELERAEGTILERHNITLEEETRG